MIAVLNFPRNLPKDFKQHATALTSTPLWQCDNHRLFAVPRLMSLAECHYLKYV